MMPIGSLGSTSRRRSSRPRPRLVFLLAVTALTLVVLFILSTRGSHDGAHSAATRVESRSTSRHATTTVHSATTVYDIALDPSWPAKGTSRFSDSAASKSIGDQLSAESTTTGGVKVGGLKVGGVTTTGSAGRGATTTTVRRSASTTTPKLGPTTQVTSRVTEAPAATVPVPTTAPSTTSPSETPSSTTP